MIHMINCFGYQRMKPPLKVIETSHTKFALKGQVGKWV